MKYQPNLIYDIGMHTGEDTRYYLKKGYTVLAVEANPVLAETNARRFKHYIDKGQLTILNVGISDKPGKQPFYKNHRLSEWSSFDRAIGSRNNTGFDVISVECIDTKSLFDIYGVPFYLKVDIEGNDYYCLNDIDKAVKPNYVSCEACHLEWLEVLYSKGYLRFKMIHQGFRFKQINIPLEKNPFFPKYSIVSNGIKKRLQNVIPFKHFYGSSGPFGEDTKGKWKSFNEVKDEFIYFSKGKNGQPLNLVSWFDFHAAL